MPVNCWQRVYYGPAMCPPSSRPILHIGHSTQACTTTSISTQYPGLHWRCVTKLVTLTCTHCLQVRFRATLHIGHSNTQQRRSLIKLSAAGDLCLEGGILCLKLFVVCPSLSTRPPYLYCVFLYLFFICIFLSQDGPNCNACYSTLPDLPSFDLPSFRRKFCD